MKGRFIKLSENFHHPVHLAIGFLVGIIYYLYNPGLELDKILLYAGLGSLVPDLDHLLFMFFYGRSTEYAKISRRYIKNKQIRKFIEFAKNNHKKNNGIFTHNLLTILVIYFLTVSARNNDHLYLAVFLLGCIFHFVFDVVEDFIYFGKLNSNWYLKFKRHSKDLEEF